VDFGVLHFACFLIGRKPGSDPESDVDKHNVLDFGPKKCLTLPVKVNIM
jgi:hypothetical protein